MELSEYLYMRKQENPKFTQKEFFTQLGITHATFYRIVTGKQLPASKLAWKIEKLTGGKVKAWDIILKALERKEISDLEQEEIARDKKKYSELEHILECYK
jgi:transcriptional regulator with XRE-family HTH domain